MAAGGTAAVAGLGLKALGDTCCQTGNGGAPDSVTTLTVKGQETVPVLTADGAVAHVMRDQLMHEGRSPSDAAVRRGVPGRKWVMVIDLASCDGCGTCTKACSQMHFIPPDREWIPVMKMQDAPETAPYFFPKPCFHCDNPPCTKVCPVDATFKRQDGVVLIDNERCIGCRFCMAACPYSTRHFNWGRPDGEPPAAHQHAYSPESGYPRRVGTVEKCDFCPDMAEKGLLPACAASCPMGVIYYGDENEDAVTNGLGVTVRLSKLLEERAAYRYMEELGTSPRVFYLPPKNRKFPGPKLTPSGASASPGGRTNSGGQIAPDGHQATDAGVHTHTR
jgi:molybdopterin-containing oxidoreductase family iron-sulfur binding subunit